MTISSVDHTPGAEWSVAEPEEAGFDRSRLARAGEWQANDADGEPYAILIARHGRIVAEWNFRIDPLEPARMASASKSLYSSVLGIAISEGVIESADDRVVDYYPELMDVPPGRGPKDGRHAFPENKGITFRQLIGNTSGYMKPGESPGKVFNYQSWGMGVLTHAVAAAYNLYRTSDPERGGGFGTLTEWKLRRPIGGSWAWRYDHPQVHASANLPVFGNFTMYYVTPRDMARVGLLWQRGGEWRGTQVIPRAWLEEATRVSGMIIENEPPERHVYGLGFWCNDTGVLWPTLPRDSFAASGAGKQLIWVCPSLDLVVVQSPGTYTQSGVFDSPEGIKGHRGMQELLGRVVDSIV